MLFLVFAPTHTIEHMRGGVHTTAFSNVFCQETHFFKYQLHNTARKLKYRQSAAINV